MNEMKAMMLTAHGGPEKILARSIPRPEPATGEVLVRVKACALNHLDVWTRIGLPGVTIPMPHILGCDVAGEVSGKRVIVAPGVSCGKCPACKDGWDSACPEYKIVGFLRPGGYAEFVSVPERNIMPVSDRWKIEEWASIPLVFLTAWHMLVTHGRLKSGETVLIHGASSGVGSAAVQIAKHLGAIVFTTVGDNAKIKKAEALGADHVTNYQKEEISKVIRKLTHDHGADLVFEHIGQTTWDQSLASLAKRGRLVTCGATAGGEVKIALRHLYMKQLQITGSYMGGLGELREVIKLVESGKLKPVLDRTFPLADAADAHRYLESRKHFGKVVLTI